MNYPLWRFLEELILPAVIFLVTASMALLCSIVLQHFSMSSGMTLLIKLASPLPYFLFLTGMVLGWKYSNTGILLTSFFLALIYLAVNTYGPPIFSKPSPASGISKAALLIFPLNIMIVSMLTKRRIFLTTGSLYLFLFSLQLFAVTIFCNPKGVVFKGVARSLHTYSHTTPQKFHLAAKSITAFVNNISFATCVIFTLWTFIFLFARFYYRRDIAIAGFIGIFAAAMTGLLLAKQNAVMTIYFLATGVMLVLSAVEASFSLNTIDKLTGLPTRKAMKKEIDRLKGDYAIAIIDVDDLSNFNDIYGSATGDEVLTVVADKLSDVANGAKAFRYAGEEFIALLPDVTQEEASYCLDLFRKKIESFPILVTNKGLAKNKKDDRTAKHAQVTVSIGHAVSDEGNAIPEHVLSKAEEALYLAKQKGKNTLFLYSGQTGAAPDTV